MGDEAEDLPLAKETSEEETKKTWVTVGDMWMFQLH